MGSVVEYWREGVLKPQEAGDMLGITRRRVDLMAERGEIRVFRTPGGHRRYLLTDVMAVLERRR